MAFNPESTLLAVCSSNYSVHLFVVKDSEKLSNPIGYINIDEEFPICSI